MNVIDGLRASALTSGLTEDVLSDLARKVSTVTLARNDVLFREGDPGDALYLVQRGRITVYATRDGRHINVATFGPGTFFGELALLGASSRTASARADEESTIIRVDRQTFSLLTTDHPVVMINVGQALASNLVSTTRSLVQPGDGEFVALAVDEPDLIHRLVPLLSQALDVIRPGEHTLIVPAESTSSGYRLGFDAVDAETDASGQSIWTYGSFDESEQSLAPLISAHAEAFRRHRPRTVIVGDLHGLLPAIRAGMFDRIFVACNRHESLRRLSTLPESVIQTIEVVPVITTEHDQRAWHQCVRQAGMSRPRVFVRFDEESGPQSSGSSITPEHLQSTGLFRLARAIARQRIGIAFGAGGARGFAHVGVFRFLEERGVPIDAFAGSSIGSLVAAGHAMGIGSQHGEEMLTEWLRGGQRQLFRPTLSRHSILSGRGLDRTCRELFGEKQFADIGTPLAISVADLASGRGLVVRDGPIWKAVRASCSIPAMFPPLVIGERVLVDGGVCDPLPTSALSKLGADIRIAVNISYSPNDLHRWASEEGLEARRDALLHRQRPNVLETYHASFGMALSDRAAASSALADVVVRPRFRVTAWHDFSSGLDQIRRGYEAAQQVEESLRQAIPWLPSATAVEGAAF